jgi:hypothetical protein
VVTGSNPVENATLQMKIEPVKNTFLSHYKNSQNLEKDSKDTKKKKDSSKKEQPENPPKTRLIGYA